MASMWDTVKDAATTIAAPGLINRGGITRTLNKIPGVPKNIDPAQLATGIATGGLAGNFGSISGTTGGAAPQAAMVNPGVQGSQVQDTYADTQNALGGQQRLLAALQAQKGLSNQNNAYGQQQGLANQFAGANGLGAQQNAIQTQQQLNSQLGAGAQNVNSAYAQSQALANQLGGVNGTQNLQQALQSQQALAGQQQGVLGQYQDIAAGRGPNPAMAALAQQTGQNVSNQAALMAGQRGAGSNVGLMARQAAQQGAATQQEAVGQGATLQAQQQLAALQGITGQQQAIGQTQQSVAGMAQQQLAAQQAQQQALAGQAAGQVGMLQAGTAQQAQQAQAVTAQQQAQQQAVANQANIQAQQQIGGTQNYAQNQLSQQQLTQNALAAQNQANVSSQNSINAANAGLSQTAMAGRQGMVGGLLNGAGAALGAAKGGMVTKPEHMDQGDAVMAPEVQAPAVAAPMVPVAQAPRPPDPAQTNGAASSFGKFLQGASGQGAQDDDAYAKANSGSQKLQAGTGKAASGIISKLAESAAAGAKGGMAKKHDYRTGGSVKAHSSQEKAVKSGNSYSNDKIKAVLSEGEVVLPRSVMQSKDPVRASADFVAKVLAKRRRKSA